VQVFFDIDARSNLSWSSEFVADVFDSSIPTGNRTLPSYARTDIAYSHRIRKWLTSSVMVDNLFNRRYESFTGFVNPGIRLRVRLLAAF
jgi:outer membrane cobalamin receptor